MNLVGVWSLYWWQHSFQNMQFGIITLVLFPLFNLHPWRSRGKCVHSLQRQLCCWFQNKSREKKKRGLLFDCILSLGKFGFPNEPVWDSLAAHAFENTSNNMWFYQIVLISSLPWNFSNWLVPFKIYGNAGNFPSSSANSFEHSVSELCQVRRQIAGNPAAKDVCVIVLWREMRCSAVTTVPQPGRENKMRGNGREKKQREKRRYVSGLIRNSVSAEVAQADCETMGLEDNQYDQTQFVPWSENILFHVILAYFSHSYYTLCTP